MKVLLHHAAFHRVEKALVATGLDLDLFIVQADSSIQHHGTAVANGSFAPDIIWVSTDVLEGRQFRPFTEPALSGHDVKWVQIFSAGMDWPIFRQVFDHGVRMSNSNAQAVAISEYVMAQVLTEWHATAEQRAAQKAHEWKRIRFREVAGTHWLIVGYGNIGREIARRAKAFGAKVTGVRRRAAPDEFADAVVTLGDVQGLLPTADIVVLAAALNETTRDLAGPAFFAAMKRGSFLVNIGRGGLVDEAALVKGLAAEAPKLAILDVFQEEPLPTTSPFWDHPQIRVTGHTSAASAGTQARGDQLFIDNLQRFVRGEKLINEVTASSF